MSSVILPPRLGTWDYVTLSVVVILASSVGVYHIFAAKKSKNAREFLVKSRDLGVMPLILSTAGTFISAIGILGFSAETYVNGAQFMLISISYLITIPFGMYLHLTVFFNLGSNTIFEYLEMRFNKFLRLCASALLILQTISYTSVVIYAPALALSQVAGLHLWASVGSIGIVCIIYTSMGGIKAVVWADACQVTVMLMVLLLIAVKGIIDVGGFSEIWRISTEGQRTQFHFFSLSKYSPYTVWTMTIGSGSSYLCILSTNQMLVQRYLSNKTITGARLSYAGGTICIAILAILCTFSGLVCYARYYKCDPLLTGQVTSRDQLLALFAVETLSFCEGLTGIFVAAILCATLSTLSSTLNSLSALTMEDFIRPRRPHLSEATATKISKFLAIAYGILCIALVAVAESVSGLVKMTFTINGFLGGPIFTLFTIGMLFPWVTTTGATAAFFAGLSFCGWVSIGGLITPPVLPSGPIGSSGCNFTALVSGYTSLENLTSSLNDTNNVLMTGKSTSQLDIYSYSPLWYILWSLGIGVVVSLVTSISTGVKNPEDVDPKLIFPVVINTVRKLPKSYQRYLGFDMESSKYLKINPSHFKVRMENPVSVGDVVLKHPETIELIQNGSANQLDPVEQTADTVIPLRPFNNDYSDSQRL